MADRNHPRTVRFEVLLTPSEARRIQREAMRRRLTESAYVRNALQGHTDHAEDMLERTIERIGQAVTHDIEGMVAAVAVAATVVIGQVSKRRIPAEERTRAVTALTAYYRQRVARAVQADAGDGAW
jgi:hypothetical protein